MHVGLDGLACSFGRGLEQRADVDVPTQIGERRGDDLLAAVVAVLAHLGQQDAGATAVCDLERIDLGAHVVHDASSFAQLRPVHTRDRTDLGAVAPVDLLEGIADLTHARHGAGCDDTELQQVALARRGRVGQRLQRGLRCILVTLGTETFELRDLTGAHRGIVDLEHVDLLVDVEPVLVDADHRLGATVDAGLGAGSGLFDTQLRDTGFDRLRHATGLFDLTDVTERTGGDVVGESFDEVAAAPRVDDLGGVGLLLQEQLGVAGDACREVGRQRQCLVQGVGVQALRVALGRGHRLDAGTHDVVVDVLRGERPPRGL